MTRDQLPDVSLTNSDEFEAVLSEAVERALDAGVDVSGVWEFQTRSPTRDWEVKVIALARESDHPDE